MPDKSFIIEFLKIYGISSEIFIAGISGSIVFLTRSKNMSNLQRFLTVLSGGLSANYLTPLVSNWFNLETNTLYGIAFLLGYSGMKSVETILKVITKKITIDEHNS